MHERGLRFRLMYERQSYEVDGRHRFWGGLAVGVDRRRRGADRPAPRGGRAQRDRDPPRRAGRGPAARRRRSDRGRRGRGRRELRAGGGHPGRRRLRVQPADARRLPRPELGRGEGARHAAQHRRGAAGGARARRAGVRALERLPRDPVGRGGAADRRPRDHEPLLAPVVSGRHRRERERRTLPRRGRRLPQLHVREVRRRGAAPARGHRRADLRRALGRDAADDRLRGAGRHARRRGHARRAGGAAGDRRRAARADGARVQRRDPAGPVRPIDQGRQGHRGDRAGEVQLGAGDRAAAVHRVPGHVRDHVHVRRRARRRAGARARPGRPPAGGCTPPARSSAGCSSTTTPAGAG